MGGYLFSDLKFVIITIKKTIIIWLLQFIVSFFFTDPNARDITLKQDAPSTQVMGFNPGRILAVLLMAFYLIIRETLHINNYRQDCNEPFLDNVAWATSYNQDVKTYKIQKSVIKHKCNHLLTQTINIFTSKSLIFANNPDSNYKQISFLEC